MKIVENKKHHEQPRNGGIAAKMRVPQPTESKLTTAARKCEPLTNLGVRIYAVWDKLLFSNTLSIDVSCWAVF